MKTLVRIETEIKATLAGIKALSNQDNFIRIITGTYPGLMNIYNQEDINNITNRYPELMKQIEEIELPVSFNAIRSLDFPEAAYFRGMFMDLVTLLIDFKNALEMFNRQYSNASVIRENYKMSQGAIRGLLELFVGDELKENYKENLLYMIANTNEANSVFFYTLDLKYIESMLG